MGNINNDLLIWSAAFIGSVSLKEVIEVGTERHFPVTRVFENIEQYVNGMSGILCRRII
jgi:hypothetical protein